MTLGGRRSNGEGIHSRRPLLRFRFAEMEKIAGLRDIIEHEYFGFDVEIIWDIIQTRLPVLGEQIQQILSEPSAAPPFLPDLSY